MNKSTPQSKPVPATKKHWWYDPRQTGVYNSSPPMKEYVPPHGVTENELHKQANSPPKGSSPNPGATAG